MKKRLLIPLLLLVLVVLSGCESSSDRDKIRQNNEGSMVRELVDARLQNNSFEELNTIHTKYRTKMDYAVWDSYFDASKVHLHDLMSITEPYNLVPKDYSIRLTSTTQKDGINMYLYVANLKAVPTGSSYSETTTETNFTVYFIFKFNEDSILIDFHTANRLES